MPEYNGVTYDFTVSPEKGHFSWIVKMREGLTFKCTSLSLKTTEAAEQQAHEVARQAIDNGAWRNSV